MVEDHMQSLKELAHGAGIIALLSIFGYATAFFTQLIAARYYGPSDFGLYSLAKTILYFTATIASLGIINGITRYIPYYKEKEEEDSLSGYLAFIFKYPMLMSIALGLCLLFFSDDITRFFSFPQVFDSLLKIIAFALPLRVFSKITSQIFLAEKKPAYFQATFNGVFNIVVLLGVVLIYLFGLEVKSIVILLTIASLATAAVNMILYKYKIDLKMSKKSIKRTKEWFKFSLPLFFTGIFSFFLSWTDNFVIGKVLTPEELGIYSVTFSFAMLLSFARGSFAPLFTPIISSALANKASEKITFLFKRSAAWIFGLTFPVFLIFTFYSKDILTLIYGKSYSTGYVSLVVLSIGFLVNAMTGLGGNILVTHKKTGFIFWVNFSISSLNIILNVILVPRLGILGAAIASAVSVSLQQILILWKASTLESLKFDWIYTLKFAISGVLAMLLAVNIFQFGWNKLLSLGVSGAVYGTVYLALLIALKTFTEEDKVMLEAVEKKFNVNLGFVKKLLG